MRSWMSGRGFQVHGFYATRATFTRAGHSHSVAPSRRIIPHDSGNCALVRACGHILYRSDSASVSHKARLVRSGWSCIQPRETPKHDDDACCRNGSKF
jgi:hypothetical protein